MTVDRRLSFFGMDPNSTVFEREGRVLRAGIDVVLSRAVLADARVQALVAAGALVAAQLVEDRDGSRMLEHRRIEPFTFPGEWSFSMLRDAALATLDVRESLYASGFDLKDAHSYNISFDGCRPVFIDFGSIVRASPKYEKWRAGAEFLDAFVRILRLWSRANRTAVLGFLNAVWARSEDEALVVGGRSASDFRIRMRRAYGKALIATAITPTARRSALQGLHYSPAKALIVRESLRLLGISQKFLRHPFETTALRGEISRIPRPVRSTMWANYQENMSLHSAPTPRFRRIVDLVSSLKIEDVFEVAGNQGALSQALLDSGAAKSVICSDYDEHAIDDLYLRLKARGRAGVTPIVYNVMMPDPIRGGMDRVLTGDVVIALALTHHLLLAQGYRLDAVLERISRHGRRYMIIEFMPKGLWDGISGAPVPDWYRREWFESGLAGVGRVLLSEILEENRIVYLVDLVRGRAVGAAQRDNMEDSR